MSERIRISIVTTVPLTLWAFFRGQVGYLKEHGYEVLVVSSPGELLEQFVTCEGVESRSMAMARRIAPWADLLATARLCRLFSKTRPTIVHSHTPKGGLLGMLAATAAGVPVRIYTVHGLRYQTATGLKRALLSWTERVACMLAHQVLCVSQGIRQAAIDDGLVPAARIKVLCSGSINGVDGVHHFSPEEHGPAARQAMREALGLPADALVIGYVGRVVRDKGIVELGAAWTALREQFPSARLMLVGPIESEDPVPPALVAALRSDPRVSLVGEVTDPVDYYAAMDLLVLPTYREGFPVVPLEAAAMQLPVVATRVAGCSEAVQDGVSGTLVAPRDADALARAIAAYLGDPGLRGRHGRAGRERMLREFAPERIWEALQQEYTTLVSRRARSSRSCRKVV